MYIRKASFIVYYDIRDIKFSIPGFSRAYFVLRILKNFSLISEHNIAIRFSSRITDFCRGNNINPGLVFYSRAQPIKIRATTRGDAEIDDVVKDCLS